MSDKKEFNLEQQYSHEVDKCYAEFCSALKLFFFIWGVIIVIGLIIDLADIKPGFFWFWATCLFGWIAILIGQCLDDDSVLKKHSEWENAIAMLALIRKYPSEDCQLIINAHNRASRFRVSTKLFDRDWQKPIRADVFQRMMESFLGYLESALSELEEKRAERGLDNPRNEWFDAGKTLDDGALQAAYLKKLNSEEAIIKATEQTIVQAEITARSAATLGEKKTGEQKRQGLEQELEKYAGTSTRTTFELERLQGECALTHQDGAVTAARIRVDESGEFEIYRREGEHRQRLRTISGGKAISFEFLPPAESGWLEIVRTADGEIEPIPLP